MNWRGYCTLRWKSSRRLTEESPGIVDYKSRQNDIKMMWLFSLEKHIYLMVFRPQWLYNTVDRKDVNKTLVHNAMPTAYRSLNWWPPDWKAINSMIYIIHPLSLKTNIAPENGWLGDYFLWSSLPIFRGKVGRPIRTTYGGLWTWTEKESCLCWKTHGSCYI